MRARVADSMAHRVSREAQKKNHLPSGPAQQDPVRLLEPVQIGLQGTRPRRAFELLEFGHERVAIRADR